jgi:hypothetical protein
MYKSQLLIDNKEELIKKDHKRHKKLEQLRFIKFNKLDKF